MIRKKMIVKEQEQGFCKKQESSKRDSERERENGKSGISISGCFCFPLFSSSLLHKTRRYYGYPHLCFSI